MAFLRWSVRNVRHHSSSDRILAAIGGRKLAVIARANRVRANSMPIEHLSWADVSPQSLATVQHAAESAGQGGDLPLAASFSNPFGATKGPRIRQRLKDWDAEQPNAFRDLPQIQGVNVGAMTKLERPWDRKQRLDEEQAEEEDEAWSVDDDIAASLSQSVEAGDLVSLFGSDRLLFGVSLGQIRDQNWILTPEGAYQYEASPRYEFIIRKYLERSELIEVANAVLLRSNENEAAEKPRLVQDLPGQPNSVRELTLKVRRKLQQFQVDLDTASQTCAPYVEGARKLLQEQEQCLTLEQIAEALLPSRLSKDGKFPRIILCAVHLALRRDRAAFFQTFPENYALHPLISIRAASRVAVHDRVHAMVDEFADQQLASDALPFENEAKLRTTFMGRFILRARKAIDDSRRLRPLYGTAIIGPTPRRPFDPKTDTLSDPEWTEQDRMILEYLYDWATESHIGQIAPWKAKGVLLLKALCRYPMAPSLDADVLHTFLKEIGMMMPWEVRGHYSRPQPGVKARKALLLESEMSQREERQQRAARRLALKELDKDVFEGERRVWKGVAFAVDDAGATEIDDALSLETGEEPETFWLHVHVADPASAISPKSDLAKEAALRNGTDYTAGQFQSMYGIEGLGSPFSLANGRRCLTISTKLNGQGELLDRVITPGILDRVIYMSPGDFEAICSTEPLSVPAIVDRGPTRFTVGMPPQQAAEAQSKARNLQNGRVMSRPEDLSTTEIDQVKQLGELAKARWELRKSQGAGMPRRDVPEVNLSFDNGISVHRRGKDASFVWGDPYMELTRSTTAFVYSSIEQLMLIAGESAAKWCRDRGVPVPFLGEPAGIKNREKYRRLVEEVHRPQQEAGKPISFEQYQLKRDLLGSPRLSSTPVPNVTIGCDQYIRATSPLRRYLDLLAHWQIEAALLEEHRRGTSLVGSNLQDDEARQRQVLPFTARDLDEDVLPMSNARYLRSSTRQRVTRAQLLRMAFYRAFDCKDWTPGAEDGSTRLPDTFRMTISRPYRQQIQGRLNWFDIAAWGDSESFRGHPDYPIDLEALQTGQEVEVKVRTTSPRLLIDVVRFLEPGEPLQGLLAREQGQEEAQATD
jgi:hypothetical protein